MRMTYHRFKPLPLPLKEGVFTLYHCTNARRYGQLSFKLKRKRKKGKRERGKNDKNSLKQLAINNDKLFMTLCHLNLIKGIWLFKNFRELDKFTTNNTWKTLHYHFHILQTISTVPVSFNCAYDFIYSTKNSMFTHTTFGVNHEIVLAILAQYSR